MKTQTKTSADIKIELLKKAKKLIKSGEQDYICYAIGSVDGGFVGRWKTKECSQLLGFIRKSLGGKVGACLGYWQLQNSVKHLSKGRVKDRLQWIDWMIDSLREHGDVNMRKAAKRKEKTK